MSGGYFEYKQYHIRDIAREIECLIKHNKEKDEYGYSHNFPQVILDIFQKTANELNILADKAHHIDYLVCDDYGIGSFLGAWKDTEENLFTNNKYLEKDILKMQDKIIDLEQKIINLNAKVNNLKKQIKKEK